MKLSQALIHRIMDDALGRGVRRDEKGLYIEWDRIQIETGTGKFSLWLGNAKVSVEDTVFQRIDISSGVTLTLTGLEGRLRVQPD